MSGCTLTAVKLRQRSKSVAVVTAIATKKTAITLHVGERTTDEDAVNILAAAAAAAAAAAVAGESGRGSSCFIARTSPNYRSNNDRSARRKRRQYERRVCH